MIHFLALMAAWLFVLTCVCMVAAGILIRSGVGKGRRLGRALETFVDYVGRG